MIIVNKIDHSVEDLAELYLITAKAGYHACVFTRYTNLFKKMHGPSIPPQTVLCTDVIFREFLNIHIIQKDLSSQICARSYSPHRSTPLH